MSLSFVDATEVLLNPSVVPSVHMLHRIWEQRQPLTGRVDRGGKPTVAAVTRDGLIPLLESSPSLAAAFTGHALGKQEFLLVIDACREALSFWRDGEKTEPSDLLELHLHQATAKLRLGLTAEARSGLVPLAENRRASARDRARLRQKLGEILQEESYQASTRAVRDQTADEAQKCFEQAATLDPNLLEAHLGSAALLLSITEKGSARRSVAEERARLILSLVDNEEGRNGEALRSCRGRAVALAILGRTEEAMAQFGRLQKIAGVSTADLADARHLSRFLAEALGQSRDYFKAAFPPLQLIVFSSPAPVSTGQTQLPLDADGSLEELFGRVLGEMQARVAMVGASAGNELLFISALRKIAGAEYHLALPWSREEFLRTSVQPFDHAKAPPSWSDLFQEAVEHASTIRELGQVYRPDDETAWRYTREVTAGLALLTARSLRLDIQPVTLQHVGEGADSHVALWHHSLGIKPRVVELSAQDAPLAATPPATFSRSEKPSFHREVKSMLFADIAGYSKLTEKVIHEFVDVFQGSLSSLLAQSPCPPCHVNMWGDAVYAVFDFAEEAGRFALSLSKMIRDGEEEWLRRGLSYPEYDAEKDEIVARPLNIRIGLHTGPVFAHYNPVLRQLGFTGSHVSRAARIEPVAEPGEVYASEEFAAMAELSAGIDLRNLENGSGSSRSDGFICEYGGSMPLAKNFPGQYRIYRLVPRRQFLLEEIAVAAHALYVEEQRKRGATPGDHPALRSWAELSDDLREANRAQVADIPRKLHLLGYELTSSNGLPPSVVVVSDDMLEQLAIREHDRWLAERTRQGWTLGPRRDNAQKHHPNIVPWKKLSEADKQKDRDTVLNIPRLIAQADLRVRKIAVEAESQG